MLIVIEGLDGTGKSTVAKSLANKLGAELLGTPSNKLKEARPTIDSVYEDCPLARQLFYASSVVHLSNEIQHLLENGKTVVVDRYWLSTQVYHNWKCNGEHFHLEEIEQFIVKPDFTVYLELPLSDRQARLSNRLGNTIEDNLTLTDMAHNFLNGNYLSSMKTQFSKSCIKIDASQPVLEITQAITKKLC